MGARSAARGHPGLRALRQRPVINRRSGNKIDKTPTKPHVWLVSTIRFAYDKDRASHATRWLLARHAGKLDRLKLVKLIFLADRLHLSKYGRPIVGGSYSAMPHGPVASPFLNALNDGSIDGIAVDGPTTVLAKLPADEDFLSESDIEVLTAINAEFGAKDAWGLRNMTHELEAWKKNYPGNNSSAALPYEDFFMDLDPTFREILEVIKDDQEAAEILGA